MSMWSRLKSLAGGHGALRTLASAATLVIPDDDNAFYVSGTTTITSITVTVSTRNRLLTFIGAASAGVKFTNTNTLTTAGQIFLQGSDRTLNESDVLQLYCQNDGTLILVNSTIA